LTAATGFASLSAGGLPRVATAAGIAAAGMPSAALITEASHADRDSPPRAKSIAAAVGSDTFTASVTRRPSSVRVLATNKGLPESMRFTGIRR
jgi:hypothetical protein